MVRTEFLQQPEGHFPFVVDEVLPDVAHRDVVLGGDGSSAQSPATATGTPLLADA